MPPTSVSALRSLLAAAGYQILFRSGGWVECFVHREAERWHGRGATEDEALEDVIASMLPSHVARMLLTRTLAEAGSTVVVAAPETPRSPSADDPPARALPPDEAAGLAEAPPAAGPSHADAANGTAEPAPTARSNHDPTADHRGLRVVSAPEPAPREAAAPATPPAPKLSSAEATAALDAIARGIEEQLGAFGRLAPQRQRAFLLVWICRARSYEEQLPSDREVHRRIGSIARRLGELAKLFWPGSVRALQLTSRPGDVTELRVRGAAAPSTWSAAAALADRALEEQLAEAEAQGLDPDGWLEDPRAAATGNADPDQSLAAAVKAIDAVVNALPRDGDAAGLDTAAVDSLLAAARRLRRVRTRVKDGVAWGLAMGNLRRLAPSLGSRGVKLREVLDPKARQARS
jgi:hypothetical protein